MQITINTEISLQAKVEALEDFLKISKEAQDKSRQVAFTSIDKRESKINSWRHALIYLRDQRETLEKEIQKLSRIRHTERNKAVFIQHLINIYKQCEYYQKAIDFVKICNCDAEDLRESEGKEINITTHVAHLKEKIALLDEFANQNIINIYSLVKPELVKSTTNKNTSTQREYPAEAYSEEIVASQPATQELQPAATVKLQSWLTESTACKKLKECAAALKQKKTLFIFANQSANERGRAIENLLNDLGNMTKSEAIQTLNTILARKPLPQNTRSGSNQLDPISLLRELKTEIEIYNPNENQASKSPSTSK